MVLERLSELDQLSEAQELGEVSSKLLQEEALSGYYQRRNSAKDTSARIGYVAKEAPKLGAWSSLFSCTERRRGRKPQRYAVQVAKAHPSGCRSVTPSQAAPPAVGQRPFVGPPLTLPPAALEAAVNAALDARESRRGSPDRAPSAPLPGRAWTPVWQRFPCLRVAGVPCDSPPAASPDLALTAPAAPGRATPSMHRSPEPPLLPFKAGTPRPRLLERKFAPVPLSSTALTQGAGGEQGPLTGEALAATMAGRSTPGIAEKFDLLGQQPGGRGGGSPLIVNTRVASPSAPAGGSQAEDLPSTTRSAARRPSFVAMSTPRADTSFSPATPSSARRPSFSNPLGGAPAAASPTPTSGRRLRFRGSAPGEGADLQAVISASPSPVPPPERRFSGKSGPIWRLHHKDSKVERLDRINSHRKSKVLQESPDYHRDRLTRRWELDLAVDSFHRYFQSKTGNDLNLVGLKEALGDFGLKARTRPEKLHLQKVLAMFEESPTLGFSDFCSAVEEARAKLRSTHASAVFQAWKRVDLEDVGALDQQELLRLLEVLGLQPKNPQDRLLVTTMIDELNPDANGLYSFHEAEFLVAWAREHAEASRRRLERGLKEAYNLEEEVFEELRTQILELERSFVQADEDEDGLLDRAEALTLLADYGFMSGERHQRLAGELIDHLALVQRLQDGGPKNAAGQPAGGDEEKGTMIDFPLFLSLLLNVRDCEVEEKRDDVQALFSAYDFDCSGELNIKEICQILVDLRLQPRSPIEQESIAQLLEEIDTDGSGQLNVEELTNLAQRIGEKVSQLQRKAEEERAVSLGFAKRATGQLRHAFEVLDVHHLGVLGTQEVEMAIHLMGWKISPARLKKLITDCDDDNSGRIDFSEFLWMMRHVEDEMRPPGGEARAPPGADDAAAHAAHGLPHGAHGAAGHAAHGSTHAAHGPGGHSSSAHASHGGAHAGHGGAHTPHGAGHHAAHSAAHGAHGAVPPTPSGGGAGAAVGEQQEQDGGGQQTVRGSLVVERAASNFGFVRRGATLRDDQLRKAHTLSLHGV